ncbi:hypothetical protein [Kitasatospora albolonga]|uniref:hypothetical protein n=1 Tax=Kitasatospora albolonga TaxID=68173 RepID=UPI0031EB3CB4
MASAARIAPARTWGPQQRAEQLDPAGLMVHQLGGDEVEQLDGLAEQGGAGLVGVAALGRLGGADGVLHRQVGGRRARGVGEVVGEGRELGGAADAERLGDAAVQAGAAQAGEVAVERVADQRVGEPDHAGGGFGQQSSAQGGLQGGVQAVLVVLGPVRGGEWPVLRDVAHRVLTYGLRLVLGDGRQQDVHLRLPAHHRREPEHLQGLRRQPVEAAAQYVPDALRHLGDGDQRPLGGQQAGALPEVERVTTRALRPARPPSPVGPGPRRPPPPAARPRPGPSPLSGSRRGERRANWAQRLG